MGRKAGKSVPAYRYGINSAAKTEGTGCKKRRNGAVCGLALERREPSASTTEACQVKADDRKLAGSGVYAEGLADFLFLGLASWGGQKV